MLLQSRAMRVLGWVLASLMASCAVAIDGGAGGPDPLDLASVDLGDGKADGVLGIFDADRIVADRAFFDADSLSSADVQRLFENTPYGTRSYLADLVLDGGEPAADAIVRVAREHAFNPLVLVVTLQKEGSHLSRTYRPSTHSLDFALGCGCPDDGRCARSYEGFARQLECAGDVIRRDADLLLGGHATFAGLRPGRRFTSLDGHRVWLANRATAILYTYTPHVARGYGGNWLFWNIWRRYSIELAYGPGLDVPFNEGWIGGPCAADGDCFFDDAFCRATSSGAGFCTRACDRTCPDRSGPGWAVTFCVTQEGRGLCAARCDASLAPGGCAGAATCRSVARHGEPWVVRDACLPL